MLNPIEEVASWADEPKRPSSGSTHYSDFDVVVWMAKQNLVVRRGPLAWDTRGEKWELETCPFNVEHTDGCAVVTRAHSGSLGFKCHHNGCAGRNWQAVRELFDGPREQRQKRTNNTESHRGSAQEPGAAPSAESPSSPRVVSAEEIMAMTLKEADFVVEPIITGPGVWLLNGAQKAGKTVFAAQLALSLQAPEAFLGWYSVRKSCAALFIEQDDPSGLAALKPILERSKIPIRQGQFVSVEKARFTLEPGFIEFLEREITARNLGLIVLDSYTAMRGPRNSSMDIVKAESLDLGMLDALAKKNGCLIVVIHHASKGSASLDWSDKSAGTYAMGAHSEGQIFISRFRDLPSNAPERLIQIRGRHVEGVEFVVRFHVETLSYTFVLEGAASSSYPLLREIEQGFGKTVFTPKSLCHETGISRATATRMIAKLVATGAVRKSGFGEYRLEVTL